jgi:protein-disulfide isomerase
MYTIGMSKTFWAIIAVIVVIFGGILLLNNKDAKAPTSAGGAKPTNHIEGQGKTGVTLTEYGDYQCSFCGEFYPAVKQTVAKYNEQIFFQFRNLPLLEAHQNAFAAARAAEAADMQGKFWEMHDILYENQNAWSKSNNPQTIFGQYASQLGLEVAKFNKDAASSQVNNIINADINAFVKTGNEKSTPTFFIDGKKVNPTDISVAALSKLIDAGIAAKKH